MAQATFVSTLVDEWVRLGLRDVVLCPGSRSTPLALAVARREELQVHVRIDERSAAFFALGRALASGRPVVIAVTSGTAAAELHAAVAEADLAHVALVVVSADRPPELHGVGAPQTIDQQRLYGPMVRLYEEPGVARLDAAPSWRPLARRLYACARGDAGLAGPVHLNAAFVEPLVAEPAERPPAIAVADAGVRATSLADLDLGGRRVLCVAGAGTSRDLVAKVLESQWALVGDATTPHSLAYADPLCRHDEIWRELGPDVIVRLGGIPASKFLLQRLREHGEVLALDAAGPVADPDGAVTRWCSGDLDPSRDSHRGDADYVQAWRGASAALARALEERCTGLDEVSVARALVGAANERGAALVVGSSMPVRDVEWWGQTRTTPTYSNRGANGIDGVVSTFLGVAQSGPTLGLIGDVTALHDVSGLVDGLGASRGPAVLVVSDNGGGGIFSFLTQAQALERDDFETLFATPRSHDLVTVARAFGHCAQRVTSLEELRAAIDEGWTREGLSVVVAQVPSREENVRLHEELNAAVATWWRA